jgi:ketosteroid isomerase-like protein
MTTRVSRTAQNVFKHHAEAMVGGDLDDIVSDYADDALFSVRVLRAAAAQIAG